MKDSIFRFGLDAVIVACLVVLIVFYRSRPFLPLNFWQKLGLWLILMASIIILWAISL